MGVNLEARDPGERGRFALHRFLAFDGVKPPGSPLVIPIGQAVDPAVDLVNACGRRAFPRVFGTQLQKTLKIRDFSLNPTASGCPVMPLDTSRAVPSPSLPAPPLWVRQANGSRSLVLASSTGPATASGTAPSCGVSATRTGTSPRTAACG